MKITHLVTHDGGGHMLFVGYLQYTHWLQMVLSATGPSSFNLRCLNQSLRGCRAIFRHSSALLFLISPISTWILPRTGDLVDSTRAYAQVFSILILGEYFDRAVV